MKMGTWKFFSIKEVYFSIDVGEQLKVACGELLTNANTNVEDSCDKERRMDDLAGVVSPKIDFEVHVPEQYILHSNDTADDGGATAAKAASIKVCEMVCSGNVVVTEIIRLFLFSLNILLILYAYYSKCKKFFTNFFCVYYRLTLMAVGSGSV